VADHLSLGDMVGLLGDIRRAKHRERGNEQEDDEADGEDTTERDRWQPCLKGGACLPEEHSAEDRHEHEYEAQIAEILEWLARKNVQTSENHSGDDPTDKREHDRVADMAAIRQFREDRNEEGEHGKHSDDDLDSERPAIDRADGHPE